MCLIANQCHGGVAGISHWDGRKGWFVIWTFTVINLQPQPSLHVIHSPCHDLYPYQSFGIISFGIVCSIYYLYICPYGFVFYVRSFIACIPLLFIYCCCCFLVFFRVVTCILFITDCILSVYISWFPRNEITNLVIKQQLNKIYSCNPCWHCDAMACWFHDSKIGECYKK